ncbi:uncharacterized protein BDW43DRAFT_292772 [Aspergillus alliaceus]|uniref:uncharacterized protein n=1 Tax=Petromyces alliaceus TaxID=209559 RepID=UPI0012A5AC40|nr:uncharacterized protein BDW43DRAFT_292772 [Aspergillus alliaceus]KAB8227900.1 hypothetical protein BDW43DRAFT_292772 [Aspergillus alliaceus]
MLESYNKLLVSFDSLLDIPAVMFSGAILSVWNKRLADRCFDVYGPIPLLTGLKLILSGIYSLLKPYS